MSTRGNKRAAEAEAAEAAAPSKTRKRRVSVTKTIEQVKCPNKLGQVLTCGQGVAGQLGLGEDIMEKTRFTLVSSLGNTVVDICAGGMHTVCIDRNGDVWTFGCNDEGALGRPTSEGNVNEWIPEKVELPDKAVKVSAGDSHTAALLQNGQVFAWGSFRDSSGNLGLTVKGNEPAPVQMLPGHRVLQIASGGDHLAMLTESGQIFTCGCGEQGQLGRVTARSCDRHSRNGKERLLIPAPVIRPKDKTEFDTLWAGTHCTFARDLRKGDIFVCGLNNYQQIGVRKGKPLTVFTPVISEAFAVLKDTKWSKIVGGAHHTLALDRDGVCYVLGRREYGRLGLGAGCEDALELTPVPALKGKKCINISCATASSFAVTDSGEIYAWGMGTSGQLGTGSEDDEEEPKLLKSKQIEGRFALNISAGGQHTVLLVESPVQAEDTISEPQKSESKPPLENPTKDDAVKAESIKDTDEAHREKMEVDGEKEEKAVTKKTTGRRGRKASTSSTASNESKSSKGAKNIQNGVLPVVEEGKETEEDKISANEIVPKTGGTQEENPTVTSNQKSKRESAENEGTQTKRPKLDVEENDNKMDVDEINVIKEKTSVPEPSANDVDKNVDGSNSNEGHVNEEPKGNSLSAPATETMEN